MKSLLSAPKFNQLLTISLLGLTLLGQPIKTFAQDVESNTASVEAAHSSHRKIYVNYTKWMVEPANNGRRHDYHPVPWVFRPDGSVYSGNLWHGNWQFRTKDTIHVVIYYPNHTQEDFVVKFTNPYKFTAYKNGSAYRYAVRQ